MKKFACAAICVLGLVGFVMAEEINCTVTKVEGNTVFYKKVGGGGGKKGAPAEEEKAELTSDVKVFKGEFVVTPADPAGKKGGAAKKGGAKGGGFGKGEWKKGDALEGGIKNAAFTKIDADKGGPFCQITIDDTTKKVTMVVTTGEPKAKGKKGG
ncbi:MAG TPA: hypothetical protein VE988_02325 [Gemmataceae bacterium]|nr:hypothetical protein [Gemmataceae bacterium]